MFITITNANFDDDAILDEIKAGLKLREELKALATDEEKKEAEKYGADLVKLVLWIRWRFNKNSLKINLLLEY